MISIKFEGKSVGMKIKIFIICLSVFALSCKQNIATTIEGELKKSMNDFLYSNVNYDSSKVKYRVESVNYFEEKDFYDCEFKVRVISAAKDTNGIMTATVSKDFKTVKTETVSILRQYPRKSGGHLKQK